MSVNETNDISDISELPPLLVPEPTVFDQMLTARKPPKLAAIEPTATAVYYYLNDEEVPFKIEVPVHPSKLTLAYLKCALNRQNFKCYVAQMDPFLKREVKAEITDDYAVLKPNSRGHFEFYILNDENQPEFKSGNALRATGRKKHGGPAMKATGNGSSKLMPMVISPINPKQKSSSIYHNLEVQRQRHNRRPHRATVSDESTRLYDSSTSVSKRYSMRNYASDSETSADFTSVSEMEEKYRTRKYGASRLRRRARSFSMLSTTCDDTDISVRVDLITVELNLNSNRDFGLSVIVRKSPNYHGIYVGSIEPNSVVALDGRIKTNQLIIEVNGFPLDSCTCDDAIATLQNEVHAAAKRRGTITLTLSESPRLKRQTSFHLPDESVRPLDTECWRDTVNMCYNINMNGDGQPSKFPHLPQIPSKPNSNCKAKNWLSSGVGSSASSSLTMQGKQYHINMPVEVIVCALADPRTGLTRQNPMQMSLPTVESFSGQDLINWLADNVIGLEDRKSCETYSGELLRGGFIEQKFNRNTFIAQCYYTFNEAKLQSLSHYRQMNTMRRGVLTPIDTNNPMLDDTVALQKQHKCGKICKLRRFICLHQRKLHPSEFKHN